MPRTPRNPGTGKAPHNGPSMGGGKGDGYGGQAQGPGNHSAGPGRPKADVEAVLRADKAGRLAALENHVIGLALTAEREETQVSAALGFLKLAAVSRVEVTGANGGALEITRRIVDPASD